jgi:hypothetical protein
MKITLSKAQWEMIGTKTGWIKKASFDNVKNIYSQIFGLHKKDVFDYFRNPEPPTVIIKKAEQEFVEDKDGTEEVFDVEYHNPNVIHIGKIQTSEVLELCSLLKKAGIQYNTL